MSESPHPSNKKLYHNRLPTLAGMTQGHFLGATRSKPTQTNEITVAQAFLSLRVIWQRASLDELIRGI